MSNTRQTSRKNAIRLKIPYLTTLAATEAAAQGIEAINSDSIVVKSLQEFHAALN